jgi:hypothetical protein
MHGVFDRLEAALADRYPIERGFGGGGTTGISNERRT